MMMIRMRGRKVIPTDKSITNENKYKIFEEWW